MEGGATYRGQEVKKLREQERARGISKERPGQPPFTYD